MVANAPISHCREEPLSNQESLPGAIVIGGYINALTTIRALASRGVKSIVISTTAADMAPWSRYADQTLKLRDLHSDPEKLIRLLKSQADSWKGKVLLPTNDHALEIISLHREELLEHYKPVAPAWPKVQSIIDKDHLYSQAQKLNIPVARDYGPVSHGLLEMEGLRFPLLVKPNHGYKYHALFGTKVSVVRNDQELRDQVEILDSHGLEARLMDLIPGPDTNCYNFTCYRGRQGEILGRFRIRKVRKSPPVFGVGRVACPTEENGFEEDAVKLMEAIDWHGPASLEFKQDSRDGKFYLLDFNGRLFLMAGVALQTGINYAHLAWTEAVGKPLYEPETNGWQGSWIHFLDDLYYSFIRSDLEQVKFAQFISHYKRPRAFAVASSRDPVPFLAQAFRGLKVLVSGGMPGGN